MNKNDLIAAVAERTGMSKAGAGQAVDATFDAITASLKSGQEVKIIGFGNFAVAKRAASMGRNPRTGEAIKIAASKSPKFKAGKGLKDAVNRWPPLRPAGSAPPRAGPAIFDGVRPRRALAACALLRLRLNRGRRGQGG